MDGLNSKNQSITVNTTVSTEALDEFDAPVIADIADSKSIRSGNGEAFRGSNMFRVNPRNGYLWSIVAANDITRLNDPFVTVNTSIKKPTKPFGSYASRTSSHEVGHLGALGHKRGTL